MSRIDDAKKDLKEAVVLLAARETHKADIVDAHNTNQITHQDYVTLSRQAQNGCDKVALLVKAARDYLDQLQEPEEQLELSL